MKKLISTVCLATLLLTGGVASAAQVSFGIRIGPPPQPRVVRVVPRSPGAGYVWVNGYWYPERGHYLWREGYWTLPPYRSARWVGPRYNGGRFYDGYWDGDRGRFERGQYSDRDHGRDWRGDRDHHDRDDHDRGRRY
jgi:YXWGXW repeat-containing protein